MTTNDTALHGVVAHADAAGRLFAAVLGDGCTAGDVAPRFTCSEADNIAAGLLALGQRDAAATWLLFHASEDEDGDAHALWDFDSEDRQMQEVATYLDEVQRTMLDEDQAVTA